MKKFLSLILTLFVALTIANPGNASNKIDAKAAMMVDASTGQVIYQQNANQQLPVASISKLLTVAVIHDSLRQNIIQPYTKVKIDSNAAAISNDPQYSAIGLIEGHSYPVVELLNAAMVKSADGATLALATATTGGDLEAFNLKMQQKAQNIGLKHAYIVNPVGLTNSELKGYQLANVNGNAENKMSAKDVAILANYLIKSYPQILQVAAQPKANFMISKNHTKSVQNLNKMLSGGKYTVKDVTINGLKTGTSDRAGACFVSTGTYRGHQIITVVLHANGQNKDNRFIQTQRLYQLLKDDYHQYSVKVDPQLTRIKVNHGGQHYLNATPQRISYWGQRPISNYTVAVSLKQNRLVAPIKKGAEIGYFKIISPQLRTINNEPLNYKLYSNDSIQKGWF